METTQTQLNERALRLSYFTVGYNVLEGAASIVAGAVAGSVALVGFGLDSFVESLSGGVMIWRFQPHGTLTPHEVEQREQRALKIVGSTFYILAAYVLFEAGRKLTMPTLAIWGARSHTGTVWGDLVPIWEHYAEEVTGGPIDCGHYVPEEAPDETCAWFMRFFGG